MSIVNGFLLIVNAKTLNLFVAIDQREITIDIDVQTNSIEFEQRCDVRTRPEGKFQIIQWRRVFRLQLDLLVVRREKADGRTFFRRFQIDEKINVFRVRRIQIRNDGRNSIKIFDFVGLIFFAQIQRSIFVQNQNLSAKRKNKTKNFEFFFVRRKFLRRQFFRWNRRSELRSIRRRWTNSFCFASRRATKFLLVRRCQNRILTLKKKRKVFFFRRKRKFFVRETFRSERWTLIRCQRPSSIAVGLFSRVVKIKSGKSSWEKIIFNFPSWKEKEILGFASSSFVFVDFYFDIENVVNVIVGETGKNRNCLARFLRCEKSKRQRFDFGEIFLIGAVFCSNRRWWREFADRFRNETILVNRSFGQRAA